MRDVRPSRFVTPDSRKSLVSRRSPVSLRLALVVIGASWLIAAPVVADAPVDYLQQVKPLLVQHCVKCHGVEKQQSGLRVDTAALLRQGGNYGPAVVPGKSHESYLIEVVTGDAGFRMPPEGPPLSGSQIALLKSWIDQGAPAPADEIARAPAKSGKLPWSFQPLRRPELPAVQQSGWTRNGLDHFVLAKLESLKITPSPEADRSTLLRRLSLDLTGLPPTPGELAKFLSDTSPDAYEQMVEHYLASPHYGERWGRQWLDLARYADSNGYTIDGPRSIWKYRDWVLAAFNRDLPFDQFTIDQLAGDLLPNPTLEQRIATGFHRNTLINQEGGTDQEQFRVEAVADRVDTTGAVFLGLTVGCARCHDHKYDPITQRDYYQLFAFLNNADEPLLPVPTTPQATRQNELAKQLAAAEDALKAYDRRIADSQAAWEARVTKSGAGSFWQVLAPQALHSEQGARLTALPDHSILVGGKVPDRDTFTVIVDLPVDDVVALRLEALTHDSLPKKGPGWANNGNFTLNEFQVAVAESSDEEAPAWKPNDVPKALRNIVLAQALADHSQKEYLIEQTLDNDLKTGWAIAVDEGSLNVPRTAFFLLDDKLTQARGRRVVFTFQQENPGAKYLLGRFRLSVLTREVESFALDTLNVPDNLRQVLALPVAQRTPAQKKQATDAYRQLDPERAPFVQKVSLAKKQQTDLVKQITTTMVMQERAAPRQTHIHVRGDFLRPGAAVRPNVPAALPHLPAGVKTPNRLDLARWLVSPENPLTSRVTVNRIWQQYFGRGLVDTENDFGTQGSAPSHPELLDYLATQFIAQGWSFKSLHRLIVTSATYRQASRISPAARDRDPLNQWYGRQNRLRLDAELIRDTALSVSGLLNPELGGPGVYPPQPEGIDLFTQNRKNWKESQGPDRYRRGMYIFFWRSNPYPFLTTFDAPQGNVTCTKRVRSNTPLQALTLANDRAFVEIAQAFAGRVLREASAAEDASRLDYAFRLGLSREPNSQEREILTRFVRQQRAVFAANPTSARDLAGPRLSPDQDPLESATWTALARVLLNLDEFITRE